MKKSWIILFKLLTLMLFLYTCDCMKGGSRLEKEVFLGTGITMVALPAGSFQMGHDYKHNRKLSEDINKYYPDEQPVHKVTLSAFQISSTEITQFTYKSYMSVNPSSFSGDENLPVTNVSADDAIKFCNKLSESAKLEPCYDEKTGKCDFTKNGFRLPTEAEWEYACRAGSSTLFNTGNTESDLDSAGWYIGNSGGKPHPTASKEPNAWGLYDLHGNVFEFCYDGFDETYSSGNYTQESVANPTGHDNFNLRITRGGSWFSEPSDCRSAARGCFWTGGGNPYTGFRVVRTIK
jgi:formylglycine-generating enzyme required for sulfatase activity